MGEAYGSLQGTYGFGRCGDRWGILKRLLWDDCFEGMVPECGGDPETCRKEGLKITIMNKES